MSWEDQCNIRTTNACNKIKVVFFVPQKIFLPDKCLNLFTCPKKYLLCPLGETCAKLETDGHFLESVLSQER